MAEPIKLFSSLSEQFPETSDLDKAHIAFRAVTSLIPVLGGPINEVLSSVLMPPLEKRRNEWLKDVATVVAKVAERTNDFRAENLADNDQFISAVVEASRIAIGTHQEEKRRYLRNILIKIGTVCDVDEDLQFIYLRLVGDLTPTHILILDFFWRGNARVAALNGGTLPGSYLHNEFVDKLLPELRVKSHFVDQMVQDLSSQGLCRAQSITSGIGGQVMTNYGIGFLGFILDSEEINS